MRQVGSSRDTVQRRKNSYLRDAFVFFLWHTSTSRHQPITVIGGRCRSRAASCKLYAELFNTVRIPVCLPLPTCSAHSTPMCCFIELAVYTLPAKMILHMPRSCVMLPEGRMARPELSILHEATRWRHLYHPRIMRRNFVLFVSMCSAVTFESLDLENLLLVCRCLRKVKFLCQGHRSKRECPVHGWIAFDRQAILLVYGFKMYS